MARRRLAAMSGALLSLSVLISPAAAQPQAKAELGQWGVDLGAISKTVKPGDDFFQYVNEGWLASVKIPNGFPSLDGFTEAYLKTEVQLDSVISDIVAQPQTPGSPEQHISALFKSYSDIAQRNAAGLKPIQPGVDRILAIRTRDEVVRTMAHPFQAAPFAMGVDIDSRNPKTYVVSLAQSGLGLPAPEYYTTPGEPFETLRTAYRDYIAGVFSRAGISEGQARADAILALETKMARAHWTMAEQRDSVRMYHAMSVDELVAYAPGLDWKAVLAEKQFGDQKKVVVGTDTALQKLAAVFAETPVETWRSYLAYHYIDNFADLLSEDWEKASFEFHSGKLTGVTQQRPLHPRAIQFVSSVYSQGVGRAYVKRYFPAARRAQVEEMVGYMRTSYRERITAAPWMDSPTRAEALSKLDQIVSQVGYPDRWTDYSKIRLTPDDLVGNLIRITDFVMADNVARLKEPRRDWEWPYGPQIINAGYQQVFNRISFPAAIMQPPFFDANADVAVNFGSIAAVIGHELGHAFDDQGSASDGEGRLRNWWTDAARAQFNARADVLVAQYSAFSPVEGMNLNGRLTLGENIGDLGGLSIAHDAYRKYVAEKQGGKAPVIDGYTGDQRFFLAWGQVWHAVTTPDRARQLILIDPHSPGKFRANGVVRNIDAWYEAFGVKPGEKLYLPPEQRVKIW